MKNSKQRFLNWLHDSSALAVAAWLVSWLVEYTFVVMSWKVIIVGVFGYPMWTPTQLLIVYLWVKVFLHNLGGRNGKA